MAVRISDMNPRESLNGSDLFEICHIAVEPGDTESLKSFRVTADTIAQYCKKLNNGGFNGQIEGSLDEITYEHAGVWFWSNSEAPLKGMPTTGILEVLTYYDPKNNPQAGKPTVIERLTSGNEVYCRTWTATVQWSPWAVLKNANGNVILSGITSENHINFNEVVGMVAGSSDHFFSKTPAVTITPINPDSGNVVYIANLITVEQSQFTVARFACPTGRSSVKVHSEVHNTYNTTGEQTSSIKDSVETKEEISDFSGWSDADFSYYWIATVDG